jgi:FkbM family methyltransferase
VYEAEIAHIVERLLEPGDVFIDVGANIGNHTLVAASCGAEVHAFEPVPRLTSALKANINLNNLSNQIVVRGEAIGAAAGFALINVASRYDDGSHSLIEGIEARSVEQQKVAVTSLDDYTRALRVPPTLIKVDVEGYEARVLDGASRLLQSSTVCFIIETADRIADRIGESARSVLDRLFRLGYNVFFVPEIGHLVFLESVDKVRPDLANYLCIASKSHGALAVARKLAK